MDCQHFYEDVDKTHDYSYVCKCGKKWAQAILYIWETENNEEWIKDFYKNSEELNGFKKP